jgi:hypothetical protein
MYGISIAAIPIRNIFGTPVMKIPLQFAIVLFSAIALFACGGGGGSSGPVATTQTFNAAQANANDIASASLYNLGAIGTISGITVTGTATFSSAAAVGATFEGQPALMQAETITGTFAANGTSIPYNYSSQTYYSTNYEFLGSIGANGLDYCVARNNEIIPASVKVGDNGTLGTRDCYADTTKTVATGYDVDSYVVEPDSATSIIFNVITNSFSPANINESTTQKRFRINQNGVSSLVSVTITDSVAQISNITFTVQ